MNIEDIQQFIETNLRRKDGQLSPMKPDKWWQDNGFNEYKQMIFNITSGIDIICWPQRLWHIINNILEPIECENTTCNNSAKWCTNVSKYKKTCSKKCASTSELARERFKNTCLERYGTTIPAQNEDIIEKTKRTNIERYGNEYAIASQHSRQKSKETLLERYGVDNPMKDPEIHAKFINSSLEIYGVEYPIQSEEILNNRTKTNIAKYGGPSPTNDSGVRQKQIDTTLNRYGVSNAKYIHISPELVEILTNKDKFIEFVTGKCVTDIECDTGLDITTIYKTITKYDCSDVLSKEYGRSSHEIKMQRFLDSNGISYQYRNRNIIKPRELDFYLPEYNLAIELGGLYFHSEAFGRDRYYHYDKWKDCKDAGITLLTYFDDELNDSTPIIESKILYMCGKHRGEKIGARQLTIDKVDVLDERVFLDRNHIQGFLTSRTHAIGAYYHGKLVAIMCINDRRDFKEITRFAVNIDYIVSGAFSKMLQHHINDVCYEGDIISFSDNCHSDGNMYESAGFTKVGNVAASYSYTLNGRKREHKQNYRKEKIAKKFNINTVGKTEYQLMNELGYSRVWDCGKIKWSKTIIRKKVNDGKTV